MDFLYVTGGTLAPDAPSYVERGADRDLLAHLESGETCYVLNSRQMGKSSLCVRTIGKLREQGVRTVFCDLTKFGGRNLTAEQWYAALLSEMGRDLGLRSEFLTYWKENADLPPVQRLFGALVEVGLKDDSPVVVFVDEIDVTLSLPFSADEFFAAIRQCYVGRATDDRLKRLSFCLLGTATPADLIQDTRVSPFNIGKRIELRDFTAVEAAPLAAGLGDASLLQRVLYWTGGHPYLTQRLCQAVSDAGARDVDRVCSDLFLTHSAKESDDNLAFVRNRLLKSEADLAALLDMYRKMRSGRKVPDDETNPLCALLKLSGVAKVESGNLKVRNRIYEHVFDRDWVETHLPDAEKRRQREAYRKGAWRVGLVAASMLALVSLLWLRASQAQSAEKRSKDEAEELLYIADMDAAGVALEAGDLRTVRTLLAAHRPKPGERDLRGFEWRLLWQQSRDGSSYSFRPDHDQDSKPAFIVYSPTEKLAAIGSQGAKPTVSIWDTETWQLKKNLAQLEPGNFSCTAAFSPDGSELALGHENGLINIYDVANWSVATLIKTGTSTFNHVAFLGNTSRLLSVSFDGRIRIWDTNTGGLLLSTNESVENFTATTTHDGRLLAVSRADNQISLYDTSKLTRLGFMNPRSQSFCLAFSQDGSRLFSGGEGNAIKEWSTSTCSLMSDIPITQRINALCYLDRLKLLAAGEYGGAISLYDSRDKTKRSQFFGHTGMVTKLSECGEDAKFASSSFDGTVRTWSLSDATNQAPMHRQYQGESITVTVSRSGEAAVGTKGGTAIFDVDSGLRREMLRFGTDSDQEYLEEPLCYSSDGRWLATSYRYSFSAKHSKDIALWNRTSKSMRYLRGHRDTVLMASFSQDGAILASVSYDRTVRLWDVEAAFERSKVQLDSWPMSLAFLGNRTVVVGLRDGSFIVVDVPSGREVRRIRAHRDAVSFVTLNAKTDLMATGSSTGDGTIKFWSLKNFEQIGDSLNGSVGWINRLSFSPDGRLLCSTNGSGSIAVWHVRSRRRLLSLSSGCDNAEFMLDGEAIATDNIFGESGDHLLIWRPPSLADIDRIEAQDGESRT